MDEGPYEAYTNEETDMTDQAAAPTPEDTINRGNDNDNGNDNNNDNDNNDEDEEDNNTLHPQTARKQGCENRTEEPIFNEDSNDDHDENDHDDHYSESSDADSKKKKIPRRTPP